MMPSPHQTGSEGVTSPANGHVREHGARWIVAVLTVVALALRLFQLEGQSLWSDEGLTLYRSSLPWSDILTNRIVVDGVVTRDLTPPGYFLLLAAVRHVVDQHLFVLRSVAAMIGAATVPLAWHLGRELFGRVGGLAIAVLLCLSPLHIWYAQELRPYAPLLFGIVLATLPVARAVRAFANAPPGRRPRWFVPRRSAMFIVGTTIALVSHYFGVLVLATHLAMWSVAAWLARRRGSLRDGKRAAGGREQRSIAVWRTLGIAGIGALLVGWFVGPRALAYLTGPPQVDFESVAMGHIVHQAVDGFAVGISPRLDHPAWRAAPMVILAAVGLLGGLQPRRRLSVLIATTMSVLPLGFLIALHSIRPMYNGPRHALIGLPGFLLLCAGGVAMLAARPSATALVGAAGSPHRRSAGRLLGRSMLLVIWAAATSIQVAQLARQFGSPDYVKDDLRSAVLTVARRAQSDDAVVLHDALIQFAWDDELRRLGGETGWRTVPRFGEPENPALRRLREIGRRHGRVWLLERPTPRFGFDGGRVPEVAREEWREAWVEDYARMWLPVRLAAFDTAGVRTPAPVEPGGGPVWIDDTARWELMGFTLSDRPRAGGALRVITRWTMNDSEAANATWNIRLAPDGAAGNASQHAGLAVRGRLAPLVSTGVDVWDIPLPGHLAPGNYRVHLELHGADGPLAIPRNGATPPDATGVTAWHLGDVSVRPADESAAVLRRRLSAGADGLQVPLRFGGAEVLAVGGVGSSVYPGRAAALGIGWWAHTEASIGARWSARLTDGWGREVARSHVTTPADGRPRRGEAGLGASSVALAVPATLRPGTYGLQLRRSDSEGASADGVTGGTGWLPERLGWRSIGHLEVSPWPSERPSGRLRAIDARFASNIGLTGVGACGDDALDDDRGFVARGGQLCIELIWQVDHRPQRDWSVFVHRAESADRAPASQADGPVRIEGLPRPTRSWRVGETIVDRRQIDVADLHGSTSSPASLYVGLYDPLDGTRATARDTEGDDLPRDAVPLGRIRVAP